MMPDHVHLIAVPETKETLKLANDGKDKLAKT
jgi:REP element-mobilizing transposase RayT